MEAEKAGGEGVSGDKEHGEEGKRVGERVN